MLHPALALTLPSARQYRFLLRIWQYLPYPTMRMKIMKKCFCALLLVFSAAMIGMAQQVPVQEVVLDNGLRVLMVPRKGDPNIAAGWIARVGSVNERPGI